MSTKPVFAAFLALALTLLALPAVAQAAPASGEWTFTGSLSAPVRSETQVEVSVVGTAEVSQGLLDQAAFTQSCAQPDYPQVVPALMDTSSKAVTPLTVGGLALIPIDDTSATSINANATISPGTYELVLQFRCSNQATWTGNVSASPSKTVTVASLVSTQYRTLACLATSPPTQCTPTQPQFTSVPSGTSVTLGAVIVKTWSDGATTSSVPTGTQAITRTTVSSSTFYSTVSSSCTYTFNVTSDYKYRCEVGSQTFDPVVLLVASPTSNYSLGLPSVAPTFAPEGATVTVRGSVQRGYSDGSLWPADTSTTFSIEFLETGAREWRTIVSSRQLTAVGSYVAAFTMPGSGQVRTKVGSSTSTPVTLTLLESSDTYRIGTLSLPVSAPPRQPLAMSVTVQSLWSDNTYRDAPNGTEASLEFAPAFDRTADDSLQWRTIVTREVLNGRATFTPTPQASGFWRVDVNGTTSAASFLEVTGSAPIQMTSTIKAAAGETPFVDVSSRYEVSASLTGYVGSETVVLYADLGGGMQKVGNFNGTGSLSGTYSLVNGPTRGSLTVSFEARDPRGFVLASSTGSVITLDEVKTYTVTAIPARGQVREGKSARVNVLLSGTSYNGLLVSVPWRGTVRIQKRSQGSWSTVSTYENVRGNRLKLKAENITKGVYRIQWVDEGVNSDKFRFKVLTLTGAYRLTNMKASDRNIEFGDRSRLSAVLKAQYSNGKFYRAASGTQVDLQVLSGSTWKTQRSVKVTNGRITTNVRPGGTRTYRFATSSGVASPAITINVTVPQPSRLVVDWPSSYYADEGANFTVVIRTTNGSVWTGTTSLRLEYRFATYESWRVLDTATYRGRRLSWGWGSGTYDTVYFRVVAPSLGLSDSEVYS